MNNKGQVIIFAFMLCVVIFILALGLAFPIREMSDKSMNVTSSGGMDCSNSSINDYTKSACYVTDASPFFFVGGLFCIGGIVLVAKIIYG